MNDNRMTIAAAGFLVALLALLLAAGCGLYTEGERAPDAAPIDAAPMPDAYAIDCQDTAAAQCGALCERIEDLHGVAYADCYGLCGEHVVDALAGCTAVYP